MKNDFKLTLEEKNMAKAGLEHAGLISQEEMDKLWSDLELAFAEREEAESQPMMIWRGCRMRCNSSSS